MAEETEIDDRACPLKSTVYSIYYSTNQLVQLAHVRCGTVLRLSAAVKLSVIKIKQDKRRTTILAIASYWNTSTVHTPKCFLFSRRRRRQIKSLSQQYRTKSNLRTK
jgi:hypothetical protein